MASVNVVPLLEITTWVNEPAAFPLAFVLSANVQYTASVSGTAKDLSGHTLANPTTWRYATGG